MDSQTMLKIHGRAPLETGDTHGFIDRFFHISLRGSTIGREIRGGIVTFVTMIYILVVNTALLSAVSPADISAASIGAGIALVASIMTIAMGLIANFPLAMGSGIGISVMVTTTVAGSASAGMTYSDGMGLVFWEGVVITLLVITGLRKVIFDIIPTTLKLAISVGLGFFIALVGLVNGGIIRQGGSALQLGASGAIAGWPATVFFIGLLVITILYIRGVQGYVLIGLAVATVSAIIIQNLHPLPLMKDASGAVVNPNGWATHIPQLNGAPIAMPSLESLGAISFFGAFEKMGVLSAALVVFSLLLADFFDTMGTMVAIGGQAGLLDETGTPPKASRILLVDSLGVIAGALGGVSSNTSYVESASGVAEGARTGLASVVTGILLALTMFLAPIVEVIPIEAVSPALVFVGLLMVGGIKDIEWTSPHTVIPVFMTIAMMPFTYSITGGIGFGFIFYVIVTVAQGQWRRISPLMWVVTGLFVIYFCLEPISAVLGL